MMCLDYLEYGGDVVIPRAMLYVTSRHTACKRCFIATLSQDFQSCTIESPHIGALLQCIVTHWYIVDHWVEFETNYVVSLTTYNCWLN